MAFEKFKRIPLNNNYQKVSSAASRIAQLPVVRSSWDSLSVLYRETKRRSAGLESLCAAVESGVTALSAAASSTLSPVLVKLEPQISIANDVACRSLDWLENSFPLITAPTDEVVAAAKTKLNEICEVVSVTTSGSADAVLCMTAWLSWADGGSRSLAGRAIGVASMGLDSALSMSEALVDQVLPPAEQEKDTAHSLEGFEAATPHRSYPVRVIKLTNKVCKRTYFAVRSNVHVVQVTVSRPTLLVHHLHTGVLGLVWTLQGLPQYLQHQVVAGLFFLIQMYSLHCPSLQRGRSRDAGPAAAPPPRMECTGPQSTPAFRLRPTRTMLENGCNVKGCVSR